MNKKNTVEYKKNFFQKIKKLLPYFVNLSEDGSILFKEYFKDYMIGGLNR